MTLTNVQRSELLHLRAQGTSIRETARLVGCSVATVHRLAPGGMVSTAPLRRIWLDAGVEATDVCRELGWVDQNGSAQTGRLYRIVGANRQRCVRIQTSRRVAAAILAVLAKRLRASQD